MLIGNYIGGDALYNLRVGIYGIEVSFRFIANQTTKITHLRYFNAFSYEKPGYHLGTGGKINIRIATNGINNNPSDIVLATADIPNPLSVGKFPLVKLTNPISIEKGKIYHIVFKNYDSQPDKNYVSVNSMSVFDKTQPFIQPNDLSVLFKSNYNNWKRFESELLVPIFTLYNDINPILGYSGMESWLREPRHISLNRKVRERFISDKDYMVNGVWVRIGKNGIPQDLTCSLMNKGIALTKKSIPSISINTIKTVNGYRLGHNWVYIKFDSPVKIFSGNEYYILFENNGLDSYEVFPIRDGESFGFIPLWSNSYAEYSIDNQTWVGWDAFGATNLKFGKLQTCLEVQ